MMVRECSLTLGDDKGWYVETALYRHGPFVSEEEASNYMTLLSKVSAAGIACSWLTRDKRTKSFGSGLIRLARLSH